MNEIKKYMIDEAEDSTAAVHVKYVADKKGFIGVRGDDYCSVHRRSEPCWECINTQIDAAYEAGIREGKRRAKGRRMRKVRYAAVWRKDLRSAPDDDISTGWFHEWAQMTDENGYAEKYALVEDEDGFIHEIAVSCIQFIDRG